MLVMDKKVDAVSLQTQGKIDKIKDIILKKSILPSNCNNNKRVPIKQPWGAPTEADVSGAIHPPKACLLRLLALCSLLL